MKKFKIIEPVVHRSTSKLVKKVAKNNSIHYTTVWRWLKKYRQRNDIRDLIPKYRERGSRDSFSNQDRVINDIKDLYLTPERPSKMKVFELLRSKYEKQNSYSPSYPTVCRIIDDIDQQEVTKKRLGKRREVKEYFTSEGVFPHASWILQTVQIDHTPIDVIVVDQEYREPIGRPYITVAIDVHSRTILGYCITFDNPSRLSIASTLLHCVEDKENTLKKVIEVFPELDKDTKSLILNSKWKTVGGLPLTIHIDNGKDFRSKDLKLFASAYGVHLHYRPIGGPQYGGHIERFLGTLNSKLQSLRGTTFSNRIVKGQYNSRKQAVFTIDELEAKIIIELVIYHENYHKGIMTTPIEKWFRDIQDDERIQYIPNTFHGDSIRLFMDLLPSMQRTVQRSGISIFNLKYQSKELERFLHVKDKHSNKKMRHIIRYDPRDIRHIFFYDQNNEEYIKIYCMDPHFNRIFSDRPVSKWEWDSFSSKKISIGKSKEDIQLKMSMIGAQLELDNIALDRTKVIKKRNEIRRKRNQDLSKIQSDDIEVQTSDTDVKKVKKEFSKKEIDWSKVEKLPTDSMYKGE